MKRLQLYGLKLWVKTKKNDKLLSMRGCAWCIVYIWEDCSHDDYFEVNRHPCYTQIKYRVRSDVVYLFIYTVEIEIERGK